MKRNKIILLLLFIAGILAIYSLIQRDGSKNSYQTQSAGQERKAVNEQEKIVIDKEGGAMLDEPGGLEFIFLGGSIDEWLLTQNIQTLHTWWNTTFTIHHNKPIIFLPSDDNYSQIGIALENNNRTQIPNNIPRYGANLFVSPGSDVGVIGSDDGPLFYIKFHNYVGAGNMYGSIYQLDDNANTRNKIFTFTNDHGKKIAATVIDDTLYIAYHLVQSAQFQNKVMVQSISANNSSTIGLFDIYPTPNDSGPAQYIVSDISLTKTATDGLYLQYSLPNGDIYRASYNGLWAIEETTTSNPGNPNRIEAISIEQTIETSNSEIQLNDETDLSDQNNHTDYIYTVQHIDNGFQIFKDSDIVYTYEAPIGGAFTINKDSNDNIGILYFTSDKRVRLDRFNTSTHTVDYLFTTPILGGCITDLFLYFDITDTAHWYYRNICDQLPNGIVTQQQDNGENVCGDGNIDPREECDDGNTSNTDSCTNICTIS